MAGYKEDVGVAFDTLTTTINHSCDPNAFVYFEGKELRVRSLKKIAAGEEITILYVDPNLDVVDRREVLQHEHFFECRCKFVLTKLHLHMLMLSQAPAAELSRRSTDRLDSPRTARSWLPSSRLNAA